MKPIRWNSLLDVSTFDDSITDVVRHLTQGKLTPGASRFGNPPPLRRRFVGPHVADLIAAPVPSAPSEEEKVNATAEGGVSLVADLLDALKAHSRTEPCTVLGQDNLVYLHFSVIKELRDKGLVDVVFRSDMCGIASTPWITLKKENNLRWLFESTHYGVQGQLTWEVICALYKRGIPIVHSPDGTTFEILPRYKYDPVPWMPGVFGIYRSELYGNLMFENKCFTVQQAKTVRKVHPAESAEMAECHKRPVVGEKGLLSRWVLQCLVKAGLFDYIEVHSPVGNKWTRVQSPSKITWAMSDKRYRLSGNLPPAGWQVLHDCGVPLVVSPDRGASWHSLNTILLPAKGWIALRDKYPNVLVPTLDLGGE
jgi:hypothetical protein